MTAPADTAYRRRRERHGMLLALASAAALGMAVAVSRFAYEGGTNGITVASTRGVVLVSWVFVFCLLSGRRLRLPRRDWLHCAGLGVLTAMMFYGNVGAVEFIPIGLAALLFFTYPPMIAVINIVVLREAVGATKLTAVAAGFAGLVLMLGVSFGAADWRGVALVMAAAVAAAWNAVWLARRATHIDPFVLTFHMALIAAVILLLIAWTSGNVVWPTAPGGWGGMAGVVILQSSGVPLYFIALGLIGALRCGVVINFQPVVSIAAAYLMFGEVLSLVQMFGGAMVLGGIWLAQYSDARARALDA